MLFEVLLNLDSYNEELKSKIYEILSEDAEDLNKIFRILFLQFEYRQRIFTAQEIISFICVGKGSDELNEEEAIEVLNFEILLGYASSNLISFQGIKEYCESCKSERICKYEEAIKKSLVVNPISCISSVYELKNFYSSSDVLSKIEVARRYMKGLKTLIRKAKREEISYAEWKKREREWSFLKGDLSEEEKEEKLKFEREWKFKLSEKGKKQYGFLRRRVRAGEKIEFFEVLSLKNEIGDKYFEACCSKLWAGLEKEFNKINMIESEEVKVEKLLALMSRI